MTTLSGLWVGCELPQSALLCIKSHLDHGFGFRLFVYPHLFKYNAYVPEGCEIEDANAILSKDEIYKQKVFNSYAPFVDWWRYTYQYRIGEPVIDLDMICMRPWTLEHWAYYTPGKQKGMNGWLNFPAGHQLMLDLSNCFLFPNNLEHQAEWIQKAFPNQYNNPPDRPLKAQRRMKFYGWAGSAWIAEGIKHYQLEDHLGVMLWPRYFPAPKWRELFNGTVRPDDPRLDELNELHLHGNRIFNFGNDGIFDERSKDSVFAHLWSRHFG